MGGWLRVLNEDTMNRNSKSFSFHKFHPNCRDDIHGLNSAAFFTLLCAKVFVVLYQHIPKKVSSF